MTTRAAPSVPLLDEAAPMFGAVTRRILIRVGTVWAVVWALGVLLITIGDPTLHAIGAGLLVPGGGFATHGHAPLTVASLLLVAVATLVWWMIGAAALPIAVWALLVLLPLLHGTSHGAGWTPDTIALAALAPAVVALALAVHAVRHRVHLRTAQAINARLDAVHHQHTPLPSAPTLPVGEASDEDLSRLRFALDLALQPLDSFDGFDRRDQFREAALRYQLCILGYALATFRYNRTPAFSGYLAEAHAASISKMSDRRVWGYWPLENAWGRFSTGRDPVKNNDNIMLTGWQGVNVGMFETLEDDRFSQPGGLPYRWSDTESYDHDFHALAASIEANMHRSPYTLFSCEPRWIYPVCNTFGANTLVLHDRLHGTDHFSEVEDALGRSFREEFHRPDGRMVGVRNETLGLSWNSWSSESVQMPTSFWMHSFMPELAFRSWWMVRENSLRVDGDRFVLPRNLGNRCDAGSYSFGSEVFGQTFLAMVAREMGDEEVARSALGYVDDCLRTLRSAGAARYEGLSTQGNLYSLMARFGRSSGTRDLIAHGVSDAWRTGPHLAGAAYPDVLVAHAVTDGAALDLVLRPGAGPVRAELVIDRLSPDRLYRTDGATGESVRADAAGRATLTVELGGRTPVRVVPTW